MRSYLLHKNKQQGYALIEVLIAAAIVALVSATVSTGMSLGLRGAAKAREGHAIVIEAENQIAGIRGGLPSSELKAIYPKWSIRVSERQIPFAPPANEVQPVNVTLTTEGKDDFSISLIVLMTSADMRAFNDAL